MATGPTDDDFTARGTDLAVRLVAVGLLGAWCFFLIRPFVAMIVWGGILGIALRPVFLWFERMLGGRSVPAAVLLTLLGLAIIIGPVGLLVASFATGVQTLAAAAAAGTLHLPEPPDFVLDLPLFGQQLHTLWAEASGNLEEFLQRHQSDLSGLLRLLVGMAATAGLTMLQFVGAMIIAGIAQTQADSIVAGLERLADRLTPERGRAFIGLTAATVRNVARGVVGISVLQGLLLGLGFLVAGVPFAGLLALLCVFLAIVQIGPTLIVVGVTVYVWVHMSTLTAVLFTIWIVPANVIDNVLKPIVMSRGLPVPMLVILVGVIGGTLVHGIVGLFVGPVILAMGYEMLRGWVQVAGPETPAVEDKA
ncbi:MAG: AI-2E family transporter [Pseudomonadota bacterium]